MSSPVGWVVLLVLYAPVLIVLFLTPFLLLEWLCETPHRRDHSDLWPFAFTALGVVILLVIDWLLA